MFLFIKDVLKKINESAEDRPAEENEEKKGQEELFKGQKQLFESQEKLISRVDKIEENQQEMLLRNSS